MANNTNEDELLRSAALQNAQSIFLARQRTERNAIEAKEALERKTEELAQQRECFQATLSSIGDAVITTDTEARVTFLNPVAETLTGWKAAEAAGQPLEKVFRIIHEDTRLPMRNPVDKVLNEGVNIGLAHHMTLISREGKETPIEDSAVPIRNASGKAVGAVMVFHDVMERRRTERELRQSEARQNLAMEAGQMGAWEWIIATGKVTWSATLEAIHGLTPGTFGGSFEDIQREIHPDDHARVMTRIQESLEHQNDFGVEYRIIKPDGTLCWIEARGKLFMDSHGQPERMAGVCMDITARKKLEEVRSRLAAVVEFSDDAIVSKTLQGIITTWNAGAQRIFGYSAEEVIGKSITILIPPDRGDEETRILERVKQGKTVLPYETIRVTKDGRLLNVSLTVSPVKDASGIIVGVSKIARDITQRKQAEAERARLLALEQAARAKAEAAENRARFLAEASASLASTLDYEVTLGNVARAAVPEIADGCAVHLLDRSGAIRRVGVAYADPAQRAISEELQKRYPDPPDAPKGIPAVLRSRKPELYPEISDESLVAVARDSEHLAILRSLRMSSAMIVPIVANQHALGTITFVMAESGRHFTEADLPFAEDLAARAATAAENARLYQELHHANAAKDHFMAVLSHELRTPLNPVLMIVADLERDDSIAADIREQMTVVRRNVELEARLIDDLLDSTRIAKGKLQLHRKIVDTAELIRRAIAIVEGDARAKGVRLEVMTCPEPCPVDADPARLQQVIWNIVKNAVKFTPKGGWVRLSCEIALAGRVRITVEDNGIGIPREHLGKIFNAFEQGDPRTSHHFGGLGLGLAISKMLVTLHAGSLIARSDGPNQGATFLIELPLAAQPSPKADSGSLPAPPRILLRLLLVEDDEMTSKVMVRLLTKRGYCVSAASSIQEALSRLEEAPIDLLISDVGLPDGSGRKLMEKVRQSHPIPGIALSGYGTEADLAQSSDVGFSVHLTKPIDIELLDRKIQSLASQAAP